MKSAPATVEPSEQVNEGCEVADSAEQALLEEAKTLRRRRWRIGGAVLVCLLVLGAVLGIVFGPGSPSRSRSVPTPRGSKTSRSALEKSSGRIKAPTLRFSTYQAGLTARAPAHESSVSGTWVVPGVPISAYGGSVMRPRQETWMWMGLTAYRPGSLIRVGVDAFTTTRATSVHYEAFWKLGATTVRVRPLGHLVAPGDELHASISESSPGADWVVALTDVSKGWRFRQIVGYRGRELFPLWFEEAPTLVSKRLGANVAVFAPVKPVTFSRMRVNGRLPIPGRSTYVEMVNTTTGQASVPRYTSKQATLTITRMSTDDVLRHNPL